MRGRKTDRSIACTASALSLALLLVQLLPAHFSYAQNEIRRQIDRLFERESVTILVTDSGLGGLSVCADLEAQLSRSISFKKVRLIFVNALPDAALTYNSMATKEEQARMFDKALDGFVHWYRPDMILIACNTLSAVYPATRFASHATIPVVSIIDVGAHMIAERVKAIPNSSVLILGTATTISSRQYEQSLGELGVPTSNIVTQSCPLLETEIQADPKSDLVGNLVEVYVSQAMEKIGKHSPGPLVVGHCCSHYGYSLDAFENSLRQTPALRYEILNPNKAMVALFERAAVRKNATQRTITVEVASRVKFTPQEVSSISRSVDPTSKKSARALKRYAYRRDLFQSE